MVILKFAVCLLFIMPVTSLSICNCMSVCVQSFSGFCKRIVQGSLNTKPTPYFLYSQCFHGLLLGFFWSVCEPSYSFILNSCSTVIVFSVLWNKPSLKSKNSLRRLEKYYENSLRQTFMIIEMEQPIMESSYISSLLR